MPRLFRESPLNSIWEGSGNVQCLDVLRAMIKSPASLEAFFAEVGEGAAAEPRLAAYARRPARRAPRRRRDDRDPRPPPGRADGARPAGLAAGPLRRRGGRRRLLRLPPRRRLGPGLRHPAGRHRLHAHHRPPPRHLAPSLARIAATVWLRSQTGLRRGHQWRAARSNRTRKRSRTARARPRGRANRGPQPGDRRD